MNKSYEGKRDDGRPRGHTHQLKQIKASQGAHPVRLGGKWVKRKSERDSCNIRHR